MPSEAACQRRTPPNQCEVKTLSHYRLNARLVSSGRGAWSMILPQLIVADGIANTTDVASSLATTIPATHRSPSVAALTGSAVRDCWPRGALAAALAAAL
jgi:hypothetical protein